MNKIAVENIPCKFAHDYWEDVAGDGGTRMQMFECGCDTPMSEEQQTAFENQTECGPKCPGYQPMPVLNCEKHGEYIDCCDNCVEEEYREAEKAAEEYYKRINP